MLGALVTRGGRTSRGIGWAATVSVTSIVVHPFVAIFATCLVAQAQERPVTAGQTKNGQPLTTRVEPSLRLTTWREAVSLLRSSSAVRISAQETSVSVELRGAIVGMALPRIFASGYLRDDVLNGRLCDPNSLMCINDKSLYGGSVTAVQPLFAPATWVAARAADHDVNARKQTGRDLERRLTLQMLDTIAAVSNNQRLMGTLVSALEATVERASLVKEGIALGSMATVDLVRMEQDIPVVQKSVVETNDALARAEEDLAILLGQDHPVGVTDDFDLSAASVGCEPETAELRPDVLAAERAVDASRTRVNQMRMQYLPVLNFVVALNVSSFPYATNRHHALIVGGDLTVPLFDSGTRASQVHVAEANAAQAAERSANVLRIARLERARSDRQVTAARDALRVAKNGLRLAIETERLARAAVVAGSGTTMELIDAGRRQRESAVAVSVSEMNVVVADVKHVMTSGRCNW